MEEKGGDYRQLESAPPRPEYLAMKSASIEGNFYPFQLENYSISLEIFLFKKRQKCKKHGMMDKRILMCLFISLCIATKGRFP